MLQHVTRIRFWVNQIPLHQSRDLSDQSRFKLAISAIRRGFMRQMKLPGKESLGQFVGNREKKSRDVTSICGPNTQPTSAKHGLSSRSKK